MLKIDYLFIVNGLSAYLENLPVHTLSTNG